jgi:RNA polymerase primary sigma factor
MNKVKPNDYEEEIDYYFYSLRNYKKLSREEERELAIKIQEGDNNALNKLVEHNLRFVVKVAKGYRDRGVSFADLISEGNLGLIHAAKKFDPNKDIKFVSYAVWWIRCYINDFITEHTINNKEISTDSYTNYQYHEDFINEKFEENLNNLNDRNSTIADLIICLKDRERDIIQMSFGLNGEKEMTLDEISKVTDLSMERVRQIKDTAIMKLKCEALSRPTDEFNEIKMLS